MGKIIFFFSLLAVVLNAQELSVKEDQQLQKECLQCHAEQQIHSGLVYRRYLMKYSTSERMQKAIFAYMKNPDQKHSIMPPQFFLKFPMKEATTLNDDDLNKMIARYLDAFDVRKKFVLPE